MRYLLGRLHQQDAARLEPFGIEQVNKSEATLQSIQPDTCPRRKLICAEGVISNFEAEVENEKSATDKPKKGQLEIKKKTSYSLHESQKGLQDS